MPTTDTRPAGPVRFHSKNDKERRQYLADLKARRLPISMQYPHNQ